MEKVLRFFVLLFFINSFFYNNLEAQESYLKNKSEQIEVINGKRFYFHTVLKKQTLYAIAKAYEVTIDTILSLNPEAKQGIKVDQVLHIPIMGQNNQTYYYKADAKETLYSIAKIHNLEVYDLIQANPELSEGLKEGQIIIIPQKKLINHQNINDNPDKTKPIGIKNSACNPTSSQKTFNVALMIPLYLEDINKLDLGEIKVVEKFKKNKSFTFVPFYEGVLMALDSLQQLGISINLFVYDVEKDTNKLATLLKNPEMKTMDLFIGPFFNEPLKKMIAFAKPLNINVVSPLSFDNTPLKSNPNAFQVMPSPRKQLENIAKFLLQNYPNSNFIIVHNEVDKDLSGVVAIKNILDSLTNNNAESKVYKEVLYNKKGIEGIKSYLSAENENIIITFSSDEVFVMNYVRTLSALIDKYKILLVGTPVWRSFEIVETNYFLKLNLHLTSTCFIDYENPEVINLVRKYREQYYSEPDKYVFQGFDEAFFFINFLKTYGKDFENCIINDTIVKYNGLSTQFKFDKSNPNDGFENNYTTIYKYDDFKLINLINKE